MEILIAILMYLGILSPEATTSMSSAELDYLIQSRQDAIHQVLTDESACQSAADAYTIDRRED